MSLIIEKCIKGGICLHENKESSYSKYWNVNNLHGSAMPQKLPVYDLNGLKMFVNLMKALSKVAMKRVTKNISLKLISNT